MNRSNISFSLEPSLIGLALFALGACAAPPQRGILVMAHGGDAEWNRQVERVVEPLKTRYPTEIAFGMADPKTIEEATARLEQQGVDHVAVVRMYISGESFRERTERILGLSEPLEPEDGPHQGHSADGGMMVAPATPISTQATFAMSDRGVGESPLVDAILVDRLRDLSDSPENECVLIVAHGPGDDAENDRWLSAMRTRVARLRDLGPFQRVECMTLREDWRPKRESAEKRIRSYVQECTDEGFNVIVIPFRVAGFGPYEDVLEGLTYVADGRGFCPHPNMTEWIELTARECFENAQ